MLLFRIYNCNPRWWYIFVMSVKFTSCWYGVCKCVMGFCSESCLSIWVWNKVTKKIVVAMVCVWIKLSLTLPISLAQVTKKLLLWYIWIKYLSLCRSVWNKFSWICFQFGRNEHYIKSTCTVNDILSQLQPRFLLYFDEMWVIILVLNWMSTISISLENIVYMYMVC